MEADLWTCSVFVCCFFFVVMEMIPGMGQLMQGKGDQGQQKIKAYMTIMDSMTAEELDNPKVLTPQRITRIARGAGRSVREIQELLTQHKQFEKVVEKMRGTALAILLVVCRRALR